VGGGGGGGGGCCLLCWKHQPKILLHFIEFSKVHAIIIPQQYSEVKKLMVSQPQSRTQKDYYLVNVVESSSLLLQ